MPNVIALAEEFTNMVDDEIVMGPITSDLTIPTASLKFLDAKTVHFPKVTVDGLGTHTRDGKFTTGDVDLSYEAKTLTIDRSRSFSVDSMNDVETLGVAFGDLGRTFLRTQVIPEVDAIRFSKIAAATPSAHKVAADIADDKAMEVLDTAILTLDEAEIPEENRIIYASNALVAQLEKLSTITKNIDFSSVVTNVGTRVISYKGIPIKKVPSSRFYSEITLKDGKTTGQEAGGYSKATTGKEINFILAWIPAIKGAVVKHSLAKIYLAGTVQGNDNHALDYRMYHDMIILDNKAKGIYTHTKA